MTTKKQTFESNFLKSSEQSLLNLIKFEFKLLNFQSKIFYKSLKLF